MWEELCDPHGEDINSLIHCITDYINRLSTQLDRDIKALLREKKRAFTYWNKERRKTVQKGLWWMIRKGKKQYRKKMVDQL